MRDDVRHLGVVVGDPAAPRVVALGTSAVVRDASLVPRFWGTHASRLDSGVQAHLYTRPGDVLVVRVPPDDDAAHRLAVALDAGARIWERLLGVRLATCADDVVAVTGARDVAPPPASPGRDRGVTWRAGSMDDAVVERWEGGGVAVLVLVLVPELLGRLGADDVLLDRARTVARLMDKVEAVRALAAAGVPCPPSWGLTADDATGALARLPADGRFVVKPAGGAAGIGVATGGGHGLDRAGVVAHVAALRAGGRLPDRFQVQEHVPGPVGGASLLLDGAGGCEVLEVHEQLVDGEARFVGARWSRAAHDRLAPQVARAGRAASVAVGVPLAVGVDLAGGLVLELNPRVTASTPVAHLLRHADVLRRALGANVRRIDLDARVDVPFDAVVDGRLDAAVDEVRRRHATLVLPQGVNPFGPTRVAFVGDDEARTARATFARLVA